MVVAVDFIDLTGDCRLNKIVLESVTQYHHVDYIEEHQEKADVLNPGLFNRLQ